jgi:hypothetical protein
LSAKGLVTVLFLGGLAWLAAYGLQSSTHSSGSAAPVAATTVAPVAYTAATAAPPPERVAVANWLTGNPPTIEEQGCLAGLGYDVGTLDGIEGPKTRAAISAFNTSGMLTDDQVRRCWQGILNGRLTAAVQGLPASNAPSQPVPSPPAQEQIYAPQQPAYGGAPPAGYGDISTTTGLPRTQYVQGYTRKDGTVVQGYYRSHR